MTAWYDYQARVPNRTLFGGKRTMCRLSVADMYFKVGVERRQAAKRSACSNSFWSVMTIFVYNIDTKRNLPHNSMARYLLGSFETHNQLSDQIRAELICSPERNASRTPTLTLEEQRSENISSCCINVSSNKKFVVKSGRTSLLLEIIDCELRSFLLHGIAGRVKYVPSSR